MATKGDVAGTQAVWKLIYLSPADRFLMKINSILRMPVALNITVKENHTS